MNKVVNTTVPQPVKPQGIDMAVLELMDVLKINLDWISDPYPRAYVHNSKADLKLLLPQVYTGTDKKGYLNVTPNIRQKGSFYFAVSDERLIDYEAQRYNYSSFDVGIVFCVNLELIDASLLQTENFTNNLIADVKEVLRKKADTLSFALKVDTITVDRDEVYKELVFPFDPKSIENLLNFGEYQRVPFSIFRFNCKFFIRQECDQFLYDYLAAIVQNSTFDQKLAVLSSLNFSDPNVLAALSEGQKTDLKANI